MNCLVPKEAVFGWVDRFIQIYGFISDGGDDLVLSTDSNEATSYSNLGNAYKHPDYPVGSAQAREFLAGSYYFKLDDIEVYCKQPETVKNLI